MTIKQIETHWHRRDRVVLVTDDHHGLVEIEYPKSHPSIGFIWHLWVDEGYRKQGYATALLDAAEAHIAARSKCSVAILEWDKRDTPVEILQWYERRGYIETEFGPNVSRLEKKLK